MSRDPSLAAGVCAVCGHRGAYVADDAPTRENHRCASCGASLRYRNQAAAITATYHACDLSLAELAATSPFAELAIYEPGIIGPFRRILEPLAGYRVSYYWPGVAPGEAHEGVRCEDLERLTWPSETFDLVITSDIFEHVRHPAKGFAEVRRVLKPGGWHIFTVPLTWPFRHETSARVDVSGPRDVHLADPVYHGSPTDPRGSLVYTDFGTDLPEALRRCGYAVTVHHGYRNAIAFAARKVVGEPRPPRDA